MRCLAHHRRGTSLAVLLLTLVALAGCHSPTTGVQKSGKTAGELSAMAAEALGGLEGTVLVAAPATGRLLAAVNSRLAFEQSFPPGSAIKPFSALAALAAGRISLDWRHRCQGGMRDDTGNLLCSHPQIDHPLGLDGALAYSCNDYFLALGERLSQPVFHDYLRRFGFGMRTGVNAVEWPGRIAPGDDRLRGAIGEGAGLLVTPVQLLRAYLGVVTGGRLCRPHLGDVTPVECRAVHPAIPEPHRRAIIEGMRGVVDYGTAAQTGLASSEKQVFGKTGTATASNGFRRHGWFVGFTTDRGNGIPAPSEIELGVVVFLRRGTGAEAAAVAARLLRARVSLQPITVATVSHPLPGEKVRVALRGAVRELPLEDYVTGVVLAENGREREREALRSQAVVARTFALGNRGRHAGDGYDLCSTTHCQRFAILAGAATSQAARAVAATAGEVLREPSGGVAEVYYHAACGGRTSSIASVWGVRAAPSWLRGVSDPLCLGRQDRRWEDRLTREQIEQALRTDPATRTIGRLRRLTISDNDPAGRAVSLTIDGDRRVHLPAWDFKLILGRTLGWNVLKSTLFELIQDRNGYVFRGRGLGHGLGLCQDGSHELARRGRSYRQILNHYFPGAVLRAEIAGPSAVPALRLIPASYQTQPSDDRRILRHGNVRWVVSPGLAPGQLERLRRILERARRDLSTRTGREIDPPLEIHLHPTTTAFIAASGQSGYAAGAFEPRRTGAPGRIDLQPPGILARRGLLESTLRHELVHATLDHLNRGTPRWLHEGLALHFTGEGPALAAQLKSTPIRIEELERQLRATHGHQRSRALYAQAWREVDRLLRVHGEPALWEMAINAGRSGGI